MGRRRRAGLLLAAALVVLAGVLGGAFAAGLFRSSPALTPAQRAALAAQRAARRLLRTETAGVVAAKSLVGTPLPVAAGAPAPAPSRLFSATLPAHEVFGYVPYWLLSGLTAADYAGASELAYFGLGLGANGSLVESGPAWADFLDPTFAAFVTAAHGARDRVLLTVSTTDPTTIDALSSSPVATAHRLAGALGPLVVANHLDGVDLDIEGRAPADRSGFVRFVAAFRTRLEALVPGAELALDTYPQSAASSADFFDVARLARYVDTVFIMGYDMNSARYSSANAPLADPELGWSDVQSLVQYTKVVPRAKLILGSPFYGYDYTTRTDKARSTVLGGDPTTATYAAIAATGRPPLWDPRSATVWTRYRVGGRWHQTWYDDPLSLALKTALAAHYRIAGVGAWAFGMEGGDQAMLDALAGTSAPRKLPLLGAG